MNSAEAVYRYKRCLITSRSPSFTCLLKKTYAAYCNATAHDRTGSNRDSQRNPQSNSEKWTNSTLILGADSPGSSAAVGAEMRLWTRISLLTSTATSQRRASIRVGFRSVFSFYLDTRGRVGVRGRVENDCQDHLPCVIIIQISLNFLITHRAPVRQTPSLLFLCFFFLSSFSVPAREKVTLRSAQTLHRCAVSPPDRFPPVGKTRLLYVLYWAPQMIH